jgi:hypothetical protein
LLRQALAVDCKIACVFARIFCERAGGQTLAFSCILSRFGMTTEPTPNRHALISPRELQADGCHPRALVRLPLRWKRALRAWALGLQVLKLRHNGRIVTPAEVDFSECQEKAPTYKLALEVRRRQESVVRICFTGGDSLLLLALCSRWGCSQSQAVRYAMRLAELVLEGRDVSEITSSVRPPLRPGETKKRSGRGKRASRPKE